MTRDKALALLRAGPDGVSRWNSWKRKGGVVPSLQRADLADALLDGVDLSCMDLERIDLRGARLDGGANLDRSRLIGAIMVIAPRLCRYCMGGSSSMA